jgi:hypothetical protein
MVKNSVTVRVDIQFKCQECNRWNYVDHEDYDSFDFKTDAHAYDYIDDIVTCKCGTIYAVESSACADVSVSLKSIPELKKKP